MQGLINLLRIPPLFFFITIKIIKQKKFASNLMPNFIKDFPVNPNGKPRDRAVSKMFTYSVVTLFIVWELEKFFGKKLSIQQHELMTIVSAMIICYDELVDEYDISENDLDNMIKAPNKFQTRNCLEKIMVNLLHGLLERIDEDKKVKTIELLLEINKVQIQSKKQKDKNISISEIERITKEKGGTTITLMLDLLGWGQKEEIKNAFYDLGGWLQLNDDYSDKLEDIKSGVKTLYSIQDNTLDIDKYNEEMRESVYDQIINIDLPIKRKRGILFIFFIFVKLHNSYSIVGVKSRLYRKLDQKSVMGSLVTMLLAVRYCYKEIYKYNYYL